MDMGQAPQVERRYREEHGKLVVEWLRQHYEIGDRGHTILKATVFHDYLVMCRTTGIESTTAAVFGRFVKKAFPTVKCSRKGLDGKSLHCYRCLKRIDDDSKTTTAAAASSEESSPRMPHPATSVDDSANTRTASYVRYGSSSAGSLEGGSGSDSTDEGYDDELRYTIEELSRAAGDALYSDQMQSTAIKTGNPATATATNNNWPTAASSASSPYHSNSFNSYNLPVEPCTATAKLLDLPEARSPPPTPNVNNGVTYYPSQRREYLLPFDPELASPSHHPYRTAPMRPTYLPQPPFDPLESYNSSTARQHPAYPQSTFATIPSSSATTSYSPRTISDTGFANAGTWPTPECDDGSLHELTHSDQDYSMTQLAAPRSGLTSYTTSFTTTSTNFTTSGLGDVLSTKTFYFKPTTSSGIKDVGMIGEPWTTSNPTPYPIANGLDMVESSPDFFPGRTLTPPFHPVHTTQSCPVHSQPSQFGPIHSVSSSTTSTYRPPMHMRD